MAPRMRRLPGVLTPRLSNLEASASGFAVSREEESLDAIADERHRQHLGMMLVAVAAVAWSTAGVFTRLIPADSWTTMFWRGVFGGFFIGTFVVWKLRANVFSEFRTLGYRGWFIVLAATAAMIPFIPALKLTAVSNVMIIYATVPFTAAALAWLWLGERPAGSTLLGGVVALCGVAVMAGGLATSANHWGELLALAMMLGTAVTTVASRRYRSVPLLPVAALSSLLGAFVILPLASPLSVGSFELLLLMIFAVVQMVLGLAAFGIGARLVTAAQAGLIVALELPLAPLWVWLAFGEKPHATAIAGGIVVLIAVVGHLVADGYDRRQRQPKLGSAEET